MDSTSTQPYNTEVWGAFSAIHETWPVPASVAAGTGIVFTQFHSGSTGSPGMALRMKQDGKFHVTRAGTDGNNVTLNDANDLIFDTVQDYVFRVIHHDTAGEVQVWRNGTEIVNVTGVSVGTSAGAPYWKFGLYAAGGIGSDTGSKVAMQFANVVKPSTTSLISRVSSPPTWPQDLQDLTDCPTVFATASSDSTATNANTFTPTLATHASGDYLMVIASIDDIDFAATPTDTSGWTMLIRTDYGVAAGSHQAVFYYGSGGVMTAAPSSSTPAPVLNMTSEQATAVAYTVQVGSAPTIQAAGEAFASQNRVMNPPILDLGSERAALWIAAASTNGSGTALTRHPAGYTNPVTKESQGTGSASTYTAEHRMTAQRENPSGFFLAGTRLGVAHTIAISVP